MIAELEALKVTDARHVRAFRILDNEISGMIAAMEPHESLDAEARLIKHGWSTLLARARAVFDGRAEP